jgi:hypothetical protein
MVRRNNVSRWAVGIFQWVASKVHHLDSTELLTGLIGFGFRAGVVLFGEDEMTSYSQRGSEHHDG